MAQVGNAAAEKDAPQVFGRYLLLKRLSRGGMGEIFLAKLGEIQGFEKPVIIKKILPHLAADEEFIKRFVDEAKVAIKLNHANIAPVFEVGKVDGEYFLAIQYIEGRDLRRTIGRQREEKTRLPTDLCLYIVRDLASGLAYAHRRTDDEGRPLSLVHCDISPPNLMLSYEGEVKIIDFGIAKSAIRLAGSNPNVGFGKFGYMAPEQLIRGGVIDRRTDIYAAGVVLYELLVGERLFVFQEGAEYREMAKRVTQGRFQPPSSRDPRIDADLDAIVMKALATKKENRYEYAEDFRDAIQTKLAQVNPTISADALALTMRRLFHDEISEEHQLLQSVKAFDAAPFHKELTATIQHTVTFARAPRELESDRDTLPRPLDSIGSTDPSRRSRALPLVYLLSGALVVGASAMLAFLLTRGPTSQPLAPPPVSQPFVPPAPQPAPPPPQNIEKPVETPMLAPVTMPSHDHPRPRHQVVVTTVTAESTQEKFRKLRGEYAEFKAQYGAVLEEKWNAISFEITYGKSADKFIKVDNMLDALRKEMAHIKAGG